MVNKKMQVRRKEIERKKINRGAISAKNEIRRKVQLKKCR